MEKKVYSITGQDGVCFTFENLQEAYETAHHEGRMHYISRPDENTKAVITVYEGTERRPKASEFFLPTETHKPDQIAEFAAENADAPEESEWPAMSMNQQRDLARLLIDTLDDWADKHAMHPDFCVVENVKTLKLEVISDTEFKVVE